MRFHRMKLGSQVNTMVITLLIVMSSIMATVVYFQIDEGVKQGAVNKAKSDLAQSYAMIEHVYPGEWNVKEGKLYKGNVIINQNEGLESIANLSGDLYSAFLGNARVATNVKNDGSKAVGTYIDTHVEDIVLKKGEIYTGEADILGESYQAAYMPIKDQSGKIIGIWSVATTQEFVNNTITSVMFVFLIILSVMILVAIMATMMFTRRINERLQVVTNAMEEAGNGNFTMNLEINSEDEIGHLIKSYNAMKSNLAEITRQVRLASEQVASSSEELMASSHQTTQAINQATLSLNQVAIGAETTVNGAKESARAMEELALGVQRIAESSSIVSEESIQAANESERGNATLQNAVSQMSSIVRSVNDSATLTKQLGTRSQEIGKIAELITSIASQINLLALNASIEAARAGENGRGFAVVANEVRKLAVQSADAALQIDGLIKGIQLDSKESVTAMDRVIVEVQSGKELVHDAGKTFQMILHAIQHVAHKIQEVSAITEEISASSEEIAASVDETARISEEASLNTQSIAAASEEQLASMDNISSSADSLSKMAQELEQLILKFKI
ncbi:MAG TPA: methyl-accepting chemotaxis protein [Paenibacillaceae bacterium]|nr:methyl-accepting chemotaxis protein [Paenibacillaceae bacterium]